MDSSTFDALSRKVAHQTTRRAALAALLGGALLLHAPAEGEATKKAERRKDRRRKQAKGIGLKPISILVDNTGFDMPVIVEHGVDHAKRNRCCRQYNTVQIPIGQSRMFDASETDAYVWINNTFWFSFSNWFLLKPDASAAINGMAEQLGCCMPEGQTALSHKGMNEGEVVVIPMAGMNFTVRRNRDTNYKSFTVFMPAVQ